MALCKNVRMKIVYDKERSSRVCAFEIYGFAGRMPGAFSKHL